MSRIQKIKGSDTFDVVIEKINAVIGTLSSINSNFEHVWRFMTETSNTSNENKVQINLLKESTVDVTEEEMTAYVNSLYS